MQTASVTNADEFYVVGLSSADVLAGIEMRLTDLPMQAELDPVYIAASSRGKRAEIYFLTEFIEDKSGLPETAPPSEFVDLDFHSVLFVNEIAMALCTKYGPALPKPIRTITRGQLPKNLGTLLEL